MIDLAVSGLTPGTSYALVAVCLVLTYRLLGVLNFSLAAFGAFGTYATVTAFGHGLVYPLAFVLGVVVSAALAAIVGLVMTVWFYDATSQVRSSVAIALLIAILAIGFRLFGRSPRSMPAPFDGWTISLAGVSLAGSTLVLLLATVALTGGSSLLLRQTSVGVQLRAISQRPVTAELLGVPARRLVLLAWVTTGALAGVALLFVAPTATGDFQSLSLLVIPAMAGAMLAGLASVWVALVGGLGLGVVESLFTDSQALSTYGEVIPLVAITAALLWASRTERWDAAR